MRNGTLNIFGSSQDITIIVDQIYGNGEADSPIISIPYSFRIDSFHQDVVECEIILISGELILTEQNIKLSESTKPISFRVYEKDVYTGLFNFLLNKELISVIEKHRSPNVLMTINMKVQLALSQNLTIVKNDKHVEKKYISGFEYGHGDASFKIEQSMWVSKILPRLGHNSYKLIELPLTNQIIPSEYKKSLVEFEEARKYFTNGDYDKTVAHCRAALDPFSGKENWPKLKEFVKSKSEFEWATKVLDSTEDWLDKIIKATSSFTSKTHHAPSVGHFSRKEAEIVLMITVGIIAYVGKIEYKSE